MGKKLVSGPSGETYSLDTVLSGGTGTGSGNQWRTSCGTGFELGKGTRCGIFVLKRAYRGDAEATLRFFRTRFGCLWWSLLFGSKHNAGLCCRSRISTAAICW